MLNYTISGNYLNWNSPYCWLVRRSDQSPSQAVQCRGLAAKNVRFERASRVELSHDCSFVARCDTLPEMMGINPDTPPARPQFSPTLLVGDVTLEGLVESMILPEIGGNLDFMKPFKPWNISVQAVPVPAGVSFFGPVDLWAALGIMPEAVAAVKPSAHGAALMAKEPDLLTVLPGIPQPLSAGPVSILPILDERPRYGHPKPPAGHLWNNPDEVEIEDMPEGFRLGTIAESDGSWKMGALSWDDTPGGMGFTTDAMGGAHRRFSHTWIVPVSVTIPPPVSPEPLKKHGDRLFTQQIGRGLRPKLRPYQEKLIQEMTAPAVQPPPSEFYNPSQVPAAFVPKGFRFLRVNELPEVVTPIKGAKYFNKHAGQFMHSNFALWNVDGKPGAVACVGMLETVIVPDESAPAPQPGKPVQIFFKPGGCGCSGSAFVHDDVVLSGVRELFLNPDKRILAVL